MKGIDILGSFTKFAADPISFGDAVERRAAKTIGKHMEKAIELCESAWAAQTNVTATVEATIKKEGAGSAKLAIDALFGTGLIATKDFTAIDLSSYKYLGLWIRANANLAAGVIQAVIDDTAACASPIETLDIPALKADVWRYVRLPFAGAGSTRTAILSAGLKAASDPGAVTLYVDDIRAGNELLGIAAEDLAKTTFAQYDPVPVIDQGKVEIGLLGTCLTGQYLKPVGNGKLAVDGEDKAESAGIKTLESRAIAIEDQATANGNVIARLI